MSRTTFSGPVASTNGFVPSGPSVAVNATAAITAANLQVGYITSTSAAVTTITLPICVTAGGVAGLATVLGAVRGQQFSFMVDNVAGASAVTMAVAAGATNALSDAATVGASAVAFGKLTIAAGVTGLAQFTLMFNGGDGVTPGSATGYCLSRTA